MPKPASAKPDHRIATDFDGIAHLLKDRPLMVPVYQRSYAWREDQVDEFWQDIRKARVDGSPEYFLGTVVLTQEPATGRASVIDGQQRLATTAMLLAALRNAFVEIGDVERAGLCEVYLADRDIVKKVPKPRLKLNMDDDAFFQALVVDRPGPGSPLQAKQPSQHRIREAFAFLSRCVAQVVNAAKASGSDVGEVLGEWVQFLEQGVRVIVVDVPTESDAFLIFETLNDRGLDLTIADLLKNYLFSLAGEDLESVKTNWISALGALDTSAEDRTFLTFLRHYWASFQGAVRERDLYKSLKVEITTQQDALKFATGLAVAAVNYHALLNPASTYWSTLGSEARDGIETMLRLGLEQPRPMLLAAMDKFPPAEIRRALRSVVAWYMRGPIAGGIPASRTEDYYCNAAVKIRSGKIADTSGLFDEVSDVIASDSVFSANFEQIRVSVPKIARYFLLALERGQLNNPYAEFVPNDNEEQVNLEHILPRNPETASDWADFPTDEIDEWSMRLGNLVLLPKPKNEKLANKSFSLKRQTLASSSLTLTSIVGSETNWTRNAIERRQKRLADLAVKTWPRQP